MPDAVTTPRTTRVAILIDATPREVYRAFLDPEAVATWLVPEGMTAHVHAFDGREGGPFRISLTYAEPDPAHPGKTTASTDTYHGRFVQLVPNEKVIQAVEFESTDPAFAGEMRMTAILAATRSGTHLTLVCDDIPPGIDLDDNMAGTTSSLERLSALVGHGTC